MSTPSSTLLDIVPTTLRKVVYSLFGTFGVAVGGVQVAYSAAGLGQPVWLTVATSVLVFLGIPVSATALLHVTPASTTPSAATAAPAPVAWPPVSQVIAPVSTPDPAAPIPPAV